MLAVVSGVLCLCVVALFVRSFWIGDAIAYSRADISMWAQSGRGCLLFSRMQDLEKDEPLIQQTPRVQYHGFVSPLALYGGPSHTEIGWHYKVGQFEVSSVTGGDMGYHRRWWVIVPDLFLVLVTALLPIRQLWHWRRMRNRKVGNVCPSCGYDLRATTSRCPECGKAVDGVAECTPASAAK